MSPGLVLSRQLIVAQESCSNYIVKWNPKQNDPIVWRDTVFAQGEVKTPRKGKRVCTIIVEEQKVVKGTTYTLKRIVRVTERTIDKTGQFLLTPDITLEGWWTDLAIAAEDVIELYRQHATSEQFHSEFKTDLDFERLPSGKFATNALVMTFGAFAYNILRFSRHCPAFTVFSRVYARLLTEA
nr:transposase [uncultured Desulfobulbus sp.]